MSNQALLQPLVAALISAVNAAIIANGSPTGWLGTYDTEAPIQAPPTNPPPYAVVTIRRNPAVGFFGADTNYDVIFEVAVTAPRNSGPKFVRQINDLLMSLHNTTLTGFTNVGIQVKEDGAEIMILQDTYTIRSTWHAFGNP